MSFGVTIQLRHLFEVVSGATPESGNAGYWDGDIAWVTPEDVSQVQGNVLRDTRRKLTAEGYANSGTKMASAGGIVLTKRAPIGQLALLGLDACSNQGCFLLSPREGIEPRFFYYVLANNVPLLQALGRGSTFMELSTDDLKVLRVPVLDYARQVAIANYVDSAVTHVDELMKSKLGVLDLLAEKRKAIIATAVTRGLDPKVKLRDSGVPWLGEIPAHWRSAQLRRYTEFITSGSRGWAEHYSSAGALFLRIGNLTRDSVKLNLSDVQRVDPPRDAEGERTRVDVGDLLFSITAYLGSIALIDSDLGDAYVSQHVALVRLDPSRNLLPRYAAYAALSHVGQAQLGAQSYGGTKMQLALDDIRELWLPVPPLDEQRAIADHIAREIVKLDAVYAATERTVALIKERRSALIAAAVTGQLDVGSAA